MTEEKFFKDLKELIEKDEEIKKEVYIQEGYNEIEYSDLSFWNEEIWINNDICIAQNRTPKQCYEILKKLIK